MRYLIVVLNIILAAGAGIAADNKNVSVAEKKNIRAARSVHLFYEAPDAIVFYNEVTVEQSQKGSYFMACGFNHGYFGIQERKKDKVVIFSIWDPGKQNNPNSVQEEKRVKVLYKDPDVYTGRFGNEGTGGQSFLKYEWKLFETYKFLVTATVCEKRTEYAAYFYINEDQQWKHLVTFSTLTNGDTLKGYYSFIEDFRRDVISAQETRRAQFGNGWVKTAQGQWIALTKAKFSADSTPLLNINAGVVEGDYFLQTGGETENQTLLWSTLERLPSELVLPEGVMPETKK
jgi:hypothetical protein